MTLPNINNPAFIKALRRLTKRQWMLIGGGFGVLLIAAYVVAFFDKTVVLSYEGQTCIKRTTLLPGLFRATDSEGYAVELADTKKVGGVALVSRSLCVDVKKSPGNAAERVSVSLFGTFLMRQRLVVDPGDFPRVDVTKLTRPVATHVPLVLPLSKTDKLHTYFLQAGDERAACQSLASALRCDIASLDLKQGSEYVLSVKRQFPGAEAVVFAEKSIKTLSAISVTSSSIQRDEVVYKVPTSVEFVFDKKIAQKGRVSLSRVEGAARHPIKQHAVLSDAGLSVIFDEALPRSAQYELHLEGFIAEDGSTLLENAYTHPFKMSGGPRVLGVSVGKTGVATGAAIVINFDQNLSPTQDTASQVSFKGGGMTLSRRASQLIIQLNGLPLCTDFSITLTDAIQSEHGVSGNSAWSFSSRTICHAVGTIGYSVKGRAINAYTFGSGATAVLYLGATHGDEISSYYLMNRWIDELEAGARSIPADKRIVVVPQLNPDGVAAGTRRNANGVDLNRNFPTVDWKSDVVQPGGQMVLGGGGSAPLSEPEAKAIASFTQQLQPRIVLTYHAIGGFITPNEAGVSSALASIYSSRSGYGISPKSEDNEVFEHDICGAYEDWLFEGPGIAAILIELGSYTNPRFETHRTALWEMMK